MKGAHCLQVEQVQGNTLDVKSGPQSPHWALVLPQGIPTLY